MTVPATVVSVHTEDEVTVSGLTLDATDVSAAMKQHLGSAFLLSEHSTSPPIDLVVTLRRFII